MNSEGKIIQLIKRELHRVIHDHSIFLTVIIAPILYAFFLGSIYLNKDINNIRFGVVDNDHTFTSRELTRKLSASPKIKLTEHLSTYREGLEEMKKLNILGFVVFPKGFEKDILKKKETQVTLYLNNTRFLPSNELNMAVNKVMLQTGSKIRLRYYENQGIISGLASGMINPLRIQIDPIYNTINSYGGFLLPALFFIILQQTLLLGITESASKDREQGLLQQDSKGIISYMIGKQAYYLVLYTAYLFFFTEIFFPVFQIPVKASLLPIFVVTILFLITVLLLGMWIGTFIKHQKNSLIILAFSTYPLFLLSGYSWPVSSMPVFLQSLAALIPTTPMMEAMRKLYLMGGTWQSVIPQFEHLLILFVLGIVLVSTRLYAISKSGFKEKDSATVNYVTS